jgi:hypothetical protein
MRSVRTLRESFYDTGRGLVDYEALKESKEFEDYRVLTGGLREFELRRLVGRRNKLSFWTNLYNTIVVDGIVSLGIKRSVQEAPEFFSRLKYIIGGQLFSADDMEHGILRGNKRPWFHMMRQLGPKDPRKSYILEPVDPRIHFALVCGSRSCAPIDYYDPATIYDQLEAATRSFVNSSEVMVLPEEGRVLLSEIFRWYEVDFGGRGGVIDFLYDYLADEQAKEFLQRNAETLQFEYIYYDWNLNN